MDYTSYSCSDGVHCSIGVSSNYDQQLYIAPNNYCGDQRPDYLPDQHRNPGKPDCPDCAKGNPINGGTGNKYQIETDFPRVGALEFVRTYNSWLPGEHTVLGAQWRHNWDRSIFSGGGLAAVTRGDG
ncbi:MAG: DUF6531 domain-containing protein, partial [Usitatibacter sp.]